MVSVSRSQLGRSYSIWDRPDRVGGGGRQQNSWPQSLPLRLPLSNHVGLCYGIYDRIEQLDSRFVLLKLSSDVWVCHRNATVSGVESNLKIGRTEGGGAEKRQ
jgi:hypothetical protein